MVDPYIELGYVLDSSLVRAFQYNVEELLSLPLNY